MKKLRNFIRSSLLLKILLISGGGLFLSMIVSGLILFLGMTELTKKTTEGIEAEFANSSEQYIQNKIVDTSTRVNLLLEHAKGDLSILAEITQKLIDHRDEFQPITEVLEELPFFKDKLYYYPTAGYSQNTSDEPTVVTIQKIYHDKHGKILPYPKKIINETLLLDLVMPSIHKQGAKKLWTYYAGDENAGFYRHTPWVDFGKDAITNYPEQMDVSVWTWYPGFVSAVSNWLIEPETEKKRVGDIVTFSPAIDAATGKSIQIFTHPLWNKSRTKFEGAVFVDIELSSINKIIEDIILLQTGFAFLALDDGQVLAIPERGNNVMGLKERILTSGAIWKSLHESSEDNTVKIKFPENNSVQSVKIELMGEEHILMMHRFAPTNVFIDNAEAINVKHWVLGLVVSTTELRAASISAKKNIIDSSSSIMFVQILALIIILTILLLVLRLILRRITSRLNNVSNAAVLLSSGNFDELIEIESIDEVGKLGQSFNKMANRLSVSFEKLRDQKTALVHEINERKFAEETLRESEERYRSVSQSANDAIVSANSKGLVIGWNKGAEKIFGYIESEIVGKSLTLIIPKAYRNQHTDGMKRMEKNGDKHVIGNTVELVGLHKSGIEFPIELSLAEWETSKGKFYSGIIRDITDRKFAEGALLEAKEKAEKANKLKTEFLAQMSHEIRTPLYVMNSFSSLLKDEFLPQQLEDNKDIFLGIETASKRIIRTVDLILNMSEIQTGSYDPVIKEINLNEILSNLQREYSQFATDKNMKLIFSPTNICEKILGDEYSVTQIFANLIDNAIKYSESGYVEINCSPNSSGNVMVSVKDTGIGISEEYLVNIFESFSQEDSGYSRDFDGNGLGLALVKKYCDMNNAEITVESKKGIGSTFSVTFKGTKHG